MVKLLIKRSVTYRKITANSQKRQKSVASKHVRIILMYLSIKYEATAREWLA